MHPEELIYVPQSELERLKKGSGRSQFMWFSSGFAWGVLFAVLLGWAG
jgi:hypothetical protein